MRSGLVSVIIPTFNRASFLCQAVDSVLSQDFASIEVLIVDDGSQDGTGELVARQYGANPKVRYFYQANSGVSAARNHGFREAQGEFLALLDSDDSWLSGKLRLQLECLRFMPEAGMVWTDMVAVDPGGAVLHARYLRKMYSTYKVFPNYGDLFSKAFSIRKHLPGLASTLPDGEDVSFFCGDIFSPMF